MALKLVHSGPTSPLVLQCFHREHPLVLSNVSSFSKCGVRRAVVAHSKAGVAPS